MRRSRRAVRSPRVLAARAAAALLLVTAALLALPLSAAAGKEGSPRAGSSRAKVYKYETRDGKVDYGMEVPEGAVVLAEVGETEVAPGLAEALPSPSAGPRGARPVGAGGLVELPQGEMIGALGLMIRSLAADPLVAVLFAAGTFLWSVLVLRAFPPLFSTLDLDLRRCARLAALVFVGWSSVALLGYGLEWVWRAMHWSPSAWFEERTLRHIALALYALVPVVAFAQRLGVSVLMAASLALLWFTLVIGPAWLVWAFVIP